MCRPVRSDVRPARASKSLSGYRVVTPDGLNSSLRRHYDLVGVLPSGSGTPESPSDIVVWRRPPGFFQTSQASHVVRMVRDALHLAKFIHEASAPRAPSAVFPFVNCRPWELNHTREPHSSRSRHTARDQEKNMLKNMLRIVTVMHAHLRWSLFSCLRGVNLDRLAAK